MCRSRIGQHYSGDRASYPYRKLKETHELIFSWLSWLVGAYNVSTTAATAATATTESAILQIKGWQRHAALVYRVLLRYWTSML